MFGKLVSHRLDHQILHLSFENAMGRLEVLSPSIINVFSPLKTPEHESRAIENRGFEETKVSVVEVEAGLELQTEALRVRIHDHFKVDFYTVEGEPICLDYRGERSPLLRRGSRGQAAEEGIRVEQDAKTMAVEVMKTLTGSEKFYGLGEKTGHLNKRGCYYENWNTDNPEPHVESDKTMYKTVPFLLTLTEDSAYGLFFDNPHFSAFDLGKESQDYYYYGVMDGNLDYYFFAGPTPEAVVNQYTGLTGRTPLPQMWTLGYQQSRFSYHPINRVKTVAAGFRAHQIPCDVLHLDIDYMDDFKVFTFDPVAFNGVEEMIQDFKTKGFKLVTIIDPGTKKEKGYSVYDEGIREGHFATDKDGIVYVNKVWPGDSVFPDFTRQKTRKWWAKQHKKLIDMGVAGIWNDMNEPASFNGPLPDDVLFENDGRPTDHREIHNVYGHLMCQATFDGLKAYDGKRPFVITRAAYAGTQKYACVWTGDNQSFWDHLRMAVPMLLNLGLSGFSFAGTDVGGFSFDTTPELMARWMQVGAFSPLFRNHSCVHTRDQEPWALGDETLAISKKFIELRYQLLPYLYDCFREGSQNGLPVLRPLMLHYPQDENTHELNDQFLFGRHIMVAPVVTQGARRRMVYFPEGSWQHFDTGEVTEGPCYKIVEAPLDSCPIYVREGAFVPLYPVMQYVGEKDVKEICVKAYAGSGDYVHYCDDGESFDYEQGLYDEIAFRGAVEPFQQRIDIEIKHLGYEGYESILLDWQGPEPKACTWLGKTIHPEQSSQGTCFKLPVASGTLILAF